MPFYFPIEIELIKKQNLKSTIIRNIEIFILTIFHMIHSEFLNTLKCFEYCNWCLIWKRELVQL